MKNTLLLVSLILGFGWSLVTQADTVKVWDNKPLTINIKVNEEVRVIFPTGVNIQVPLSTTQKLQALAPNREVIYWKATAAFDKSRIIATTDDGQDVYVIDLMASPNGLKDSITIEDPRRVLLKNAAKEQPVAPTLRDPAELVLTRFVAQTLYAPDRLLPTDTNISQLETPTLPIDFPLMQSAKGESYIVEVVGQWGGYGRYITAVLIMNMSRFVVPVNPERVRGNFTHITPQHSHLSEAGTFEDRTTLYLVSDSPFSEAVMEDGYAY